MTLVSEPASCQLSSEQYRNILDDHLMWLMEEIEYKRLTCSTYQTGSSPRRDGASDALQEALYHLKSTIREVSGREFPEDQDLSEIDG